jgi:hypothetical protein
VTYAIDDEHKSSFVARLWSLIPNVDHKIVICVFMILMGPKRHMLKLIFLNKFTTSLPLKSDHLSLGTGSGQNIANKC